VKEVINKRGSKEVLRKSLNLKKDLVESAKSTMGRPLFKCELTTEAFSSLINKVTHKKSQ